MSQIDSWYVVQRRQIGSHRMMHYTVVNSVQAAWHPEQWRQQHWCNPVKPVAICSDRAAEEKRDDSGRKTSSNDMPTSVEQPSVL